MSPAESLTFFASPSIPAYPQAARTPAQTEKVQRHLRRPELVEEGEYENIAS